MIYFDNAATGGFKPQAAISAAVSVIKYLSANPGRSGHRLAVTGAKIVENARELIGENFNADPFRVVFTKNCTEALNTAIFGTLKPKRHVITTVFEHNSVLRPLGFLQARGDITLDAVAPDKDGDIISAIKEKITDDTYLIVSTAISNVTGLTLPIEKIGELAKDRNLLFIVDGAQAGGHINIDMKKSNISALCLAGHKGMGGIMGSGILILSDETEVSPLIHGGTGTETFNMIQPKDYPERLEAGTLNLPAIAALLEGFRYVSGNVERIGKILTEKTERLIDGLKDIDGVKLYSTPNAGGIVSFSLENLSSSAAEELLNSEYDVAVRGGFHCAPLTHKFLKTDKDGLIRASLSPQNSGREEDYFLSAIRKMSKN